MSFDPATPPQEAGQQTAVSNRRRNWLIGLVISVFTIVLCLGAVELAGYLWERSTAQGSLGWTLVASRRMPLVRHGTEDAPYYLLTPGESYVWEGIPVEINDPGFRNEPFDVAVPENTYRILNLGDSVVFGWEVSQEETYGKQLQKRLSEDRNDRHYEVINAGVPGWNLQMEEDFLIQEGLGYGPDLVILDITLVNDIYGDAPDEGDAADLFDWLRDNTYAWPFLTTQARFLMARQQGPQAFPVLNPPTEADKYYPHDPEHPVWNSMWRTIEEMARASEESGAAFIVVAFPTALQFNGANHPDVPQTVLGERAAASGIPLIDLLPWYREECATTPNSCDGFENRLSADVWMHPTPLGHSIAAEAIVSELERLRLLGQ